jgi:hypothetical protein
MNPELEETIILDFITSSPTTGAAADADSTPTCAVYEETNDTAILTPTVVKRTSLTGNYRVPVACTAANGFEVGKSYAVIASATVGSVAAKAMVSNFQVRAVGVTISATTANQLADALLKRDLSAVTGEAARSLLNAVRFLRNKWTITGTTLSVKKEDDSTEAWAATITTDAAAVPIIGNDPA